MRGDVTQRPPEQPVADGRQVRWLLFAGSLLLGAVFLAYLVFALATAGHTLGCDYLTYDAATRAWLAGASPYPASIAEAGVCGIFQYPPPFLLFVAPFTLMPAESATWAWAAMLAACLPLAVLAMPMPPMTRLIVFALAGTSWPVLFAIRIGAIGPALLLAFSLAWRWRDRAGRLAAVTVVSGFAKLMPGLIAVWMLLTRRWRAAALTLLAAGAGVVLWLVLQPQLWLDFVEIERQVAGLAISAPLNVAPASLAYFHGIGAGPAQAVGAAHALLVSALAVVAALRCRPEASVIVAAIASQAVAPVLWDHYAIVVFLALAWLLARGHWWAVLMGIAMNWMLILWFQPWQWAALMDVSIVAVMAVDLHAQRPTAPDAAGSLA